MTNALAIALGAIFVAFLSFDFFWFDGAYTLFLARELAGVIEYLAFWR